MLLTCSEKSEALKKPLPVFSIKTNESAPCSLGNPLWKKLKNSVNFCSSTANSILHLASLTLTAKNLKTKFKILQAQSKAANFIF
jgi:hypothetical protein